MLLSLHKSMRATLALLIIGMLMRPALPADDHVVKTSDLKKAMMEASHSRQENLAGVRDFFSSESAAKALRIARLDPSKVDQAVSLLDDQELAQLSARTNKIRQDFIAGSLTNQQLTYIVIALATAVIVILIVTH
jgi:hypothetical protein